MLTEDFRPGRCAHGREAGYGLFASLMDCSLPAAIAPAMNDITRILSAVEQGDPLAAEQLLPLVYEELRQIAAHKLAQEKPGQTLQATALVHEAYVRLVDEA